MVCKLLTQHHQNPDDKIQFVAACDPELEACAEQVDQLRSIGVETLQSADDLLALDLDAVWMPLPIHLHHEFTIKALSAGKAVICEKPAAGCIHDVDAMIEARDRAGLPVLIGFQHLFDPSVAGIKDLLVNRRLGRIRRAVVFGCWPRTQQYYARNDWAGRRSIGRHIINDSPASNAMSHYIMLALYLLGPTACRAAGVKRVQPYLYRANRIETYDTISMRITTADDLEIDIHLTHASERELAPTVTIQAEHGGVRLVDGQDILINDGVNQKHVPRQDGRRRIATTLAKLIRGEAADDQTASLENAREHVLACELASTNTTVIDVPPAFLKRKVKHHDGEGTAINDIEVKISECVRNGRLLNTL